jgi:hypothetical protein
MLKQAYLFIAAVVVCAIAFVGIEHTVSLSFQMCIRQDTVGNENFSAILSAYIRCSGKFIAENNGGITAFATLIVAAFTGTLWAATNRQAQLTKDALIANNRAFIFVPGIAQFWERDPGSGDYNWRFRPILRNSGETPTRRMAMFVECEIRNTRLPPGYGFAPQTQDIAGGTIPPKFELTGGLVPRMPGAAITPQDLIDAQNGRKFIYV